MPKKLKSVRREGFSRVIAVTDLIPEDWNFVTCEIKKASNEKLYILITKKG